MKYLIFVLLICSCQPKLVQDVDSIKIYSRAPFVTSIVPLGDSWVERKEPIWLYEKERIDLIVNRISNLKKKNTRFDDSDLRMKCILYNERKDSSIFEYNDFEIRIDGASYHNDSLLIEYLYVE